MLNYRKLLQWNLIAIFEFTIVVWELLNSIICQMNIYFVQVILTEIIIFAASSHVALTVIYQLIK